VVEQLLKSKYHAAHLGVLNDRRLTTRDGILNTTMRQAIGLLPNFPIEGVQRPPKELGLGLPSIKERATKMGVEHHVTTMNKDTEREYPAHAHSLRLLTQFGHWPTKALESNPLKLPTLRILRLASTVHGLSMDNLPPLHFENEITTSLSRAASQATYTIRMDSRHTITSQQGTREYDKQVRQNFKPLHYSNTLLKHLAPLWATGKKNGAHSSQSPDSPLLILYYTYETRRQY
jgi:hypothetical protein